MTVLGRGKRMVPRDPALAETLGIGAHEKIILFIGRLVAEIDPAAVMLENVPGLATARFDGYRSQVIARLSELGYEASWQVLNACEFGVPQLRPRFVLVAVRQPWASWFRWPETAVAAPPTVGASA